METIVIHNIGVDAFWAGAPREAPAEVDYLVRSQYHADRVERVSLDRWMQQVWLEGFDRAAKQKRARAIAA